MKKFIAILLIALLVVVFVACGGETDTSSTPSSSDAPSSSAPTSDPADSSSTPTDDPSDPSDPTDPTDTSSDTDEPTDTPVFSEGIDIMLGDIEYNAIDPFWNGSWPCALEKHHPELNYEWCVVFKMIPSAEFVQEQLISMDAELGIGTPFDAYTWTLTIDGTDYVIEKFSIPQRSGFIYVRMGLGADYQPVEGTHAYDIKLKITDSNTNELVYWAYFTTPDWGGLYEFEAPKPAELVSTEKPSDVEVLRDGSLAGLNGPAGVNAAETYVNLFDSKVESKLCTGEYNVPIIFTINDNVTTFSIKGISIVGANDDEKFPERVFAKFKVYGASSGDVDAAWDLLLTVDKSADFGTVTNYGEYYYGFEEASSYRYYKIEIETDAARYQASEILLYTEKNSATYQ